MKIMHFFPNSSGISFLKSFQKYLQLTYAGVYFCYDKSAMFLSDLSVRPNETDIIIFTAHGTEDSIIGDRVKGTEVILTKESLSDLMHSFIFAFSCSTGALGERLCSEYNAISYIGFNDIIDLSVKSANTSFKSELSTILKSIYNQALQKSFNTFIMENYDVGQLARLISLNLKRSFSMLLSLNSSQLSSQYSLSTRVTENPIFLRKLHSDLLTTVDSVRSRIITHGEEGFVPWEFIREPKKIKEIIRKLENVKFSVRNEYYRFFLLSRLYYLDGRVNEFKQAYRIAFSLFPDYEPLKTLPIIADEGESAQFSETEIV
ncbi:hypothetical protein FHR92_001399 [Fontibacillus solani]|uniref:CHAT domain-containing protein n=1 Tax=Fontibacillus solani TaxID=1572857 RepID=A0A7W3SRY6_9BACL|nr:hypothetical protein [Fontibacillus solani]MBA9084938.1 hypothetical protein [Fontibacillus solani]